MMSWNTWADLPSKLTTMPCSNEIEKVLTKLESTDKWVETVNPQQGVLAFRSPTKKLAKWVEIQSFENPYLFYFETDKTKVMQWDSKTCATIVNSESKPLEFLRKHSSNFTDENLQSLIEAKKLSMIYIWSPTMAYSMSEMGVFRKVAETMEINFVPVLDFYDDPATSKKLLSGYKQDIKIQKFQSLELYMREGTIHFPSTYIVGKGKISRKIQGVLTPELLIESINGELVFFGGRQ